MKPLAFLLCVTGTLFAAAPAGLKEIRSVYLLPMNAGLDHYLAQHLTAAGVFQVVTDPKLAEAVFTDRLGKEFELLLEELYPPEPPAQTQPAAAKPSGSTPEGAAGELKAEPRVRHSSFARSRGNLFLVDLRTRAVLWSAYERPGNTAPEQMDRTARRLVERLKRTLGRD
ncbi:MAG: hypothetical protein K6T59_13755 [Bryobacteraceae bacterium]|jgi:hypothetical protein|nr:hypothetical protein [Bryobacteraceae bacterium]